MPMRPPDYHEWKCAACGESSSQQGHLMRDDETDEYFMGCEDPERRKRVHDRWFETWRPKT